MTASTLRRLLTASLILSLVVATGMAVIRYSRSTTEIQEGNQATVYDAGLYFEPNLGQATRETQFLSRGPGFALHLSSAGLASCKMLIKSDMVMSVPALQ